jgi:hypothetical protein
LWRSSAAFEPGPEPFGEDEAAPALVQGDCPLLQGGHLGPPARTPNDVRQIGQDAGLAIQVIRLLDRLEGLRAPAVQPI